MDHEPTLAEHFWSEAADSRLALQRCAACGSSFHYPRRFCPECGSGDWDWFTSAGLGTVYSFSVVERTRDEAWSDHLPYGVALIELDDLDHGRVLAAVRQPDGLQIGATVRAEPEAGRLLFAITQGAG